MANSSKSIYEGFSYISRGIDSGTQPVLVPRDTLAFAVNTSFRNGSPKQRPGIKRRELQFASDEVQEAFESGFWQGAGTYVYRANDTGDKSWILCSISGRIYGIDAFSLEVTDLTIASDPNPSFPPQVWFEQGEMFTFIQDGTSRPLIFNGASLRRSQIEQGEIPVGTIMCYALGRMTVVLPDRRSFVAGNLVGSTEGGTPGYNFRDSIISFTENNYLNGGGVFSVPQRINAVQELATIDTTLNQGPIQLFTSSGAYSANYPFLREEWFEITYPLVTGSLLSRGALSQNSTINVNNDIWFRAYDGIRSFWVARRDSQSWANLPLSFEVERILRYDTRGLLEYSSATLFDNRLLMTCSPLSVPERGVVHRGLVALDFQGASNLKQDGKPSYDGLWTGLRIFQILTIEVQGEENCFIFALDPEDKISLYQLTLRELFDNYGLTSQQRIQWSIETPSYSWGEVITSVVRTQKELVGGDISISQLQGNVDFTVKWRPNKLPNWQNWMAWQECATQECASLFCETPNALQYRDPILLSKPAQNTCDPSNKINQTSIGYTFQAKISVEGPAQIDSFRIQAEPKDTPKLKIPSAKCDPRMLTYCPEELFEYQIS